MSALHFSKAHASSKPTLQRRFWLVCALWLGMLEETVRVTVRTGMKGLEANTVGDKVRRLRKFILYSALSTKPKTLTFTKEL